MQLTLNFPQQHISQGHAFLIKLRKNVGSKLYLCSVLIMEDESCELHFECSVAWLCVFEVQGNAQILIQSNHWWGDSPVPDKILRAAFREFFSLLHNSDPCFDIFITFKRENEHLAANEIFPKPNHIPENHLKWIETFLLEKYGIRDEEIVDMQKYACEARRHYFQQLNTCRKGRQASSGASPQG
jgi:hypothetical protein